MEPSKTSATAPSVKLICNERLHIQHHHTVFDFGWEAFGTTDVGRHCLPVCQPDAPVVQRTGDMPSKHNALRQGSAFMRAFVRQREHFVIRIAKYRNVT